MSEAEYLEQWSDEGDDAGPVRSRRKPPLPAEAQAIVDQANAMTEGNHHPRYGVEYRASAHAFAAQCAGCSYWTGHVTKVKAAKLILAHARQFADQPPMTELEVLEARLVALRTEKKHIYGRGAARKAEWAKLRIEDCKAEIARLKAVPASSREGVTE